MNKAAFSEFFTVIQKACLPAVWSRGLALARTKAVRLEKSSSTEINLRVSVSDRPVSQKVSLWPEDEDAFCDCADRVQPCVHIAAAVAALRNGLEITDEGTAVKDALRYRLSREGEILRLERFFGEEPLRMPLTSLIGGIQSGRISSPPVDATRDDFAIDQILDEDPGREISQATWLRLMPYLRTVSETQPGGLKLGGVTIEVGASLPEFQGRVTSEGKGLRFVLFRADGVTDRFMNGPALFGSVLCVFQDSGLSEQDRKALSPPGRLFSQTELPRLLTEILPELEKRIRIERDGASVPTVNSEPPKIVLRMEPSEGGVLNVVPSIEYASEYSVRDRGAEAALVRRLETELRMTPGRRVLLRGSSAADFLKRISDDPSIERRGTGAAHFKTEKELFPSFETTGEDFSLGFKTQSGNTADAKSVLSAWRSGEEIVSLLGGGFAPLPMEWLNQFAPQLERLFMLREQGRGRLPTYARPALLDLCESVGMGLQSSLRILKERFDEKNNIPEAELPADLRAELRPYQRAGVNWLRFLIDSEMGALLADDMGLGKTLQTLCVMRGRVLVVAPKSVISAWKEQIEKFRPSLRVALYQGTARELDPSADVTLVTYGLLRLEAELFAGENWDLAVLDEAQTIKNPSSLVAQAAHRIRATARITLSGTPVENRLDDLWSQFHFLNPGLLGSHSEFLREFADPIANGNENVTALFRRRIRPFILRRLKREVAPELPARTEVVLRSDFSLEERALYDALLTSTRKEVVEKLDAGGSPLSVLELLLRLRQACCHPSLVPGQSAVSSSKLDLLSENLVESLALGHRALVFSQWTSFLDLIEPKLQGLGISFSRLDGGTTNREEIVREFQSPEGPSVLLLSLKAGGVGLTLTAADHVYLMDSWWNPAVEEQAADRAHRIGQENPVLISRFIAENTVEEKILELQKRKRALSDSVLTGDIASATIQRADLLELLNM